MGDIIEITTQARHLTPFYKITSSALSFEIRGDSAGLVGLAKEPGNKCPYWFGVGAGKVWIKGPEGLKRKIGEAFMLTNDSYKRFCIAWDSGKLRIIQGSDKTSILSTDANTLGFNYVTFTSYDVRLPPTWRLELPPASIASIPKCPSKKIQSGKLQWKTADDALPDGCVIGGFLGECLYIIRGAHASSMTPGHFVPSEGEAFVPWGGEANSVSRFQILCGYDFAWEETSEDRIPVTAFAAGFSEINNETLYIGRVKYGGGLIPGKVQPSHKVCYIAYENKEVSFKEYEILVVSDSNIHAVKPYFETVESWRPMVVNANHYFMNHQPYHDDNDEDSDENNDENNDGLRSDNDSDDEHHAF